MSSGIHIRKLSYMDTSVEKVEDFYLEPILVGQPKVDQWIPNVETV